MRAPLLPTLLIAALLAGCGGGGDSEGAALQQDEEAVTAAAGTAGVTVSGPIETKPAIELPGGTPPAELVSSDIVEGEGAEVVPGAAVTTHYVGIGWDSGEQFDSSWDRGQPIEFPLGNVIQGWQEGIPGMRVGGRRLLVIPAAQAYGDTPPPGSGIAPGETLVFVIDLLSTA